MERTDLTTAQAHQLAESVYRSLNFLARLKRRMQEVGFAHDDRLYLLVEDAYKAMQTLYVETRYLSCKSGVGNQPRD